MCTRCFCVGLTVPKRGLMPRRAVGTLNERMQVESLEQGLAQVKPPSVSATIILVSTGTQIPLFPGSIESQNCNPSIPVEFLHPAPEIPISHTSTRRTTNALFGNSLERQLWRIEKTKSQCHHNSLQFKQYSICHACTHSRDHIPVPLVHMVLATALQ